MQRDSEKNVVFGKIITQFMQINPLCIKPEINSQQYMYIIEK
jgi:hypothetical protein